MPRPFRAQLTEPQTRGQGNVNRHIAGGPQSQEPEKTVERKQVAQFL